MEEEVLILRLGYNQSLLSKIHKLAVITVIDTELQVMKFMLFSALLSSRGTSLAVSITCWRRGRKVSSKVRSNHSPLQCKYIRCSM